MNNKAILVILDGRGLANPSQEHKSAIHLANTPNFDKYRNIYPHSTLKTFGEFVGLPDGQMGNSEVGHMSIGSGRVIYQDLVKISKMLNEKSFENIEILQNIIAEAKAENKPVHLFGLLSDGGVHSHINHLKGIIEIFDRNNILTLVHAITDGRDVDPKSGIKYISELLDFIKDKNSRLTDIIGRYYAMDRDDRRERVKLAYDLYTRGIGKCTNDILSEMQKNYDNGITDEFIKPIIYTPNFKQKDWSFDILETDRLIIKPIAMKDVDDIYNGASEQISEYLVKNIKTIKDDTENFIKTQIEKIKNKTDIILVARNKQTNEFVGLGSIHNINTVNPFYGLRVSESQQGIGFGIEFTKSIINRAFQNLNPETYITYEVYEPNINSKKLANKLKAKFITQRESANRKYEKILTNIYQISNPNKLYNMSNIDNIKTGSIMIMTNFRTDRGRELVDALSQNDYLDFDMQKITNLNMITITKYDDTFTNVKVLLPKNNLTETLGEIISKSGKNQIRIAETEKYPHVTFFFSGGQEKEFTNERRILIPSPKVATYDLQPEMSAHEITYNIIPEISSGWPDFICLNFANTDMVGHTGDINATMLAAENVDECLGKIVNNALVNGYDIIVIADHGNADIMYNDDKSPNTAHTTNLVPCIYISNSPISDTINDGKLADIAPTILQIMGINKPIIMDGKSLFKN